MIPAIYCAAVVQVQAVAVVVAQVTPVSRHGVQLMLIICMIALACALATILLSY
jgi:hypothetical protein